MDVTDGSLARLAEFLQRRLLWPLVPAYFLAGVAPAAGLWLRSANVAPMPPAGSSTDRSQDADGDLALSLGPAVATTALARVPEVMLPVIFYNLVQHRIAALFQRLAAHAAGEPKIKSTSSSRPAQSLQPAHSDT